MMKIEPLIRPHHLDKVVAALHALPNFPGFTVIDAHGQGRGRRRRAGGRYVYEPGEGLLFHKQQLITVNCADDLCDEITEVIVHAAQTGQSSDGFVVVTEIPRFIRIRDGASSK